MWHVLKVTRLVGAMSGVYRRPPPCRLCDVEKSRVEVLRSEFRAVVEGLFRFRGLWFRRARGLGRGRGRELLLRLGGGRVGGRGRSLWFRRGSRSRVEGRGLWFCLGRVRGSRAISAMVNELKTFILIWSGLLSLSYQAQLDLDKLAFQSFVNIAAFGIFV